VRAASAYNARPGRFARGVIAMRLLSMLMPQERRFFALFNQHASLVVEGAAALVEMLSDYGDEGRREEYVARIQKIEHDADAVTHETVALMHNTFVTPFDRDQINKLIQRMDDILDLIQDTAESLTLYDVHTLTAEVRHLADLMRLSCQKVRDAVTQLSSMDNGKSILRICQEVDALESDADRVMRASISRLFREEKDVRQLVKLKAVYELLELATDKCQDVALVIEGVVLENG
jgi:predicted phosphate transport protein (TIGR00153 family)